MNFTQCSDPMLEDNNALPRNNNNISETCFSQVGDQFLESLAMEIGIGTAAKTVMIHRLITQKEYIDLKYNQGCPSIHIVNDHEDNSDYADSDSPSLFGFNDIRNRIKYLFLKACYSSTNDTNPTLARYSAVPIHSFIADSPHISTIRDKYHHINNQLFSSVYPTFKSFVGIRLDTEEMPIGLITVMDDKPMENDRIQSIYKTLKSVQLRTKNEIERARHRDSLIMAKNIALKDAQNKLKFLADMSHEIRTPMNAVIALTDLLLQEKNLLTREQTEHLEVIQTSGNHLLTVINDILDISKINHDPKFKLEYRRFNIRKCVKDAVNMARHQASMIQHSKLVYTVECPSDLNDDIPIRQLVKQIEANSVSLFQRQAEKTVLPLIWKIDSDVPDYLMGDSMRLTQILLNLCSNAVKFTKSGGIQVKIARYKPSESNIENDDDDSHAYTYFKQRYDAKLESTHACKESKNKRNNDIDMKNRSSSSVVPSSIKDIVDPSYCYYYDDDHEDMTTEEKEIETEKVMLELSVTDTGIGMPANRLPRLFKSFSQIDISTARRYGGTGLGLAISNMLVDRMGGALWVESKEGLGSRFALTLPLFVSPRRISSSTMTYQGYLTGSSDGSSAYADNNSVIGSPPSPSSSTSDGGSSLSDRIVMDNSISTSSPSNSTTSKRQIWSNPTKGPIPSTSSSTTSLTNQTKNLHSTTTDMNTVINTTYHTANINTITTNTTSNINISHTTTVKGLQSILNKTSLQQESIPSGSSKILKPYIKSTSVKHNNEENLALHSPIHILLAEDNVLNQKIAISILKRLGYQDVIIASNGREVLELMRIHKFDVIFMDLYMPEMDGLEATRYIMSERKKMNDPFTTVGGSDKTTTPPLLNINDIYIIALTASASRQDRHICIETGMNDFISKPFTMMEMKSALKNCVSKRKKHIYGTHAKEKETMTSSNKDNNKQSSSS